MAAMENLVHAKLNLGAGVRRARCAGDLREWDVIVFHGKVCLLHENTIKDTKMWLHHLTKEARESGKIGPKAAISYRAIEVWIGFHTFGQWYRLSGIRSLPPPRQGLLLQDRHGHPTLRVTELRKIWGI
jgi:hypothetical protein